ncbi:MAG: T9SS type A sorting domain-containing protein [Chitinophagales bacterium]|nr:T9SS type A sorting domain-containing protein [Chitinophagales bacterium]
MATEDLSNPTITRVEITGYVYKIKSYADDSPLPNNGIVWLPFDDTEASSLTNHSIEFTVVVGNAPASVSQLSDNFFVRCYPNPANTTNTLEFTSDKKQKLKVDLFDITGSFVKNVFDNFVEQETTAIQNNVNDLASGIYFYKISGNDLSANIKIVKQ